MTNEFQTPLDYLMNIIRTNRDEKDNFISIEDLFQKTRGLGVPKLIAVPDNSFSTSWYVELRRLKVLELRTYHVLKDIELYKSANRFILKSQSIGNIAKIYQEIYFPSPGKYITPEKVVEVAFKKEKPRPDVYIFESHGFLTPKTPYILPLFEGEKK